MQERVAQIVQDRLTRLPRRVRHVVEAAAVFVEPVPVAALIQPRGLLQHVGSRRKNAWSSAWEQALAAGLLLADRGRLSCRHDLIRNAIGLAIAAPRLEALHRHAAQWLATQCGADALTLAEHWRAGKEPQTALAWRHLGAEQLKARGRFDDPAAL